jgi:predicted membrane channel-forming protein YqfA (hemolysin III family)
MTAKYPKMSMEFAADKRKHVNIKKMSCPETGTWCKNQAKSNTNHDLLHIFMVLAAIVFFFESWNLGEDINIIDSN